jgi:hypothetical protein
MYSFDPYKLIGSPGYTLPNPEELEEFSPAQVKNEAVRNLAIVGQHEGQAIRILVHPEANLKRPITITMSAAAAHCTFVIGRDCTLTGQFSLLSRDQTVIIAGGIPEVPHNGKTHARLWAPGNLLFLGCGSSSNGTRYAISGQDRCVVVGDDCMFAGGCAIATTDFHSVLDNSTGAWRNPPADVIIEPHVWLADEVTIGKGVVMGLGSLAAARSYVTKNVPRSTAVGGVPAKPIASDICWDRKGTPSSDIIKRVNALKEAVAPFSQTLRKSSL